VVDAVTVSFTACPTWSDPSDATGFGVMLTLPTVAKPGAAEAICGATAVAAIATPAAAAAKSALSLMVSPLLTLPGPGSARALSCPQRTE
jgi:hypothetical protein